jgi:quercetin dioxygenase-like cupin family protein
MRKLLGATCLAGATALAAQPGPPAPKAAGQDTATLLDNERVRVFRASTTRAIQEHGAAVIVPLGDGAIHKVGEAYWSPKEASATTASGGDVGPVIIVEPKESAPPVAPLPAPDAGSDPAKPVFTGMSFKPLFENDRVAVIRGRMDVGAQEGFHTHTSDIVLVHLSGGTIEDTAEGQTKVNHWKPGDVEFEGRGSSHAARNLGAAVDAVLVTIKP